jgi:hypothetical protein
MTGGSGVIIRRPSVADSLRILLGKADCDGALGVVEMALSPGASGPPLHMHPTHAEASTGSPVNCPCRLARRSLPVVLAHGHARPRTYPTRWETLEPTKGDSFACLHPVVSSDASSGCLPSSTVTQCWLNCRRPSGQPDSSGHRSSPRLSLPDQMRPRSAVVPHDAGRGRTRHPTGRTILGWCRRAARVDGGSSSWSSTSA